jgi:hypothetical protein
MLHAASTAGTTISPLELHHLGNIANSEQRELIYYTYTAKQPSDAASLVGETYGSFCRVPEEQIRQ